MQLKVFYDKLVFLLSDEKGIDEKLITKKYNGDLKSKEFKKFIENLDPSKNQTVLLNNESMDLLMEQFTLEFQIILAAGGVVQNEEKDVLFIKRLGKWDLPKGKIDKDEVSETAAQREIEEETGVKNLVLVSPIGKSYHIYELKNKKILKITEWFFYNTLSAQKIKPQMEENITEVKWFTTKDISIPANDTYPAIKEILQQFFDMP